MKGGYRPERFGENVRLKRPKRHKSPFWSIDPQELNAILSIFVSKKNKLLELSARWRAYPLVAQTWLGEECRASCARSVAHRYPALPHPSSEAAGAPGLGYAV